MTETPGFPSLTPPAVCDLARRLGACDGPSNETVRLMQIGSMRAEAHKAFRPFSATQMIRLDRCEFRWRARTGPLGLVSVTDAFVGGAPTLEVKVLGFIPLARGPHDADAAKGEIMRYLAELAWAPDALLRNRTLDWDILDERRLRVRHGQGASRAGVELRLDDEGRIGTIFAPDRPRYEGSRFIARPWHGRFFDYRWRAGRWLPFQAEVAWGVEGRKVTVWRGEIVGWELGQGGSEHR